MSVPRILVAGVGNVFFGDDGFGVEVARRLLEQPLPEGVVVKDFGIRGFDLAYALLDDYDGVILVDAARRGAAPGTVCVLEIDPDRVGAAADATAPAHGLTPDAVLRLVRVMGGRPRRLLLVGCEPATLGSDEEPVMGLSDAVRPGVDEAVRIIQRLVATGGP
jgi:hydrogenase maturation protease